LPPTTVFRKTFLGQRKISKIQKKELRASLKECGPDERKKKRRTKARIAGDPLHAKSACRGKGEFPFGQGRADRKTQRLPVRTFPGQQQRVAIARALALNPDILCFDEPTSALDPELTGEVLKVIKGLKSSDSTMIVVTHEMEFARNVADLVIFMADGVIEEMGTPAEVFDFPKSDKTRAFLQKSLEQTL